MLANLKLATVLIAILAVNVGAQSTTATAAAPTSTPACVTTCIQSSLSPDGCANTTNLECLCTNTEFLGAFEVCAKASCNDTERAEAYQLGQDECTPYTSSFTSSAISPSSTHSSSSSAAIGKVHIGYGAFMGAAVGLLGAVAGAALSL